MALLAIAEVQHDTEIDRQQSPKILIEPSLHDCTLKPVRLMHVPPVAVLPPEALGMLVGINEFELPPDAADFRT